MPTSVAEEHGSPRARNANCIEAVQYKQKSKIQERNNSKSTPELKQAIGGENSQGQSPNIRSPETRAERRLTMQLAASFSRSSARGRGGARGRGAGSRCTLQSDEVLVGRRRRMHEGRDRALVTRKDVGAAGRRLRKEEMRTEEIRREGRRRKCAFAKVELERAQLGDGCGQIVTTAKEERRGEAIDCEREGWKRSTTMYCDRTDDDERFETVETQMVNKANEKHMAGCIAVRSTE
ncbi:hypothetical protein AXG93_215s1120 [Marchantia polymorpha subsp. ruderalis]|uniref:Uncharacterized protein n=1 Tax=Marchantia polymorpha subsp. ruderalis TaxID=1480154 RepID=A0A176W2X7_MARPO|nr:hypothetical protein AXG93_215s1120 [Marchantia polymorpha subsp. ruderalis]